MQEIWETLVRSLGWEDSPGGGPGNLPVLLPGESHGQGSLVSYSPWGHKESDTPEHALTFTAVRTREGPKAGQPEAREGDETQMGFRTVRMKWLSPWIHEALYTSKVPCYTDVP